MKNDDLDLNYIETNSLDISIDPVRVNSTHLTNTVCEQYGSKQILENKICPNCGSEILHGIEKDKVLSPSDSHQSPYRKTSSQGRLVTVLVVVALILVGGGLFYWYHDSVTTQTINMNQTQDINQAQDIHQTQNLSPEDTIIEYTKAMKVLDYSKAWTFFTTQWQKDHYKGYYENFVITMDRLTDKDTKFYLENLKILDRKGDHEYIYLYCYGDVSDKSLNQYFYELIKIYGQWKINNYGRYL